MNIKPLPPLAYLKELFTYNKETGSLTWRGGEEVDYMNRGYVVTRVDGMRYQAHRICYYMGMGVQPEYVDHINGVKNDNRLENLRSVTHKDNMRNSKKRKDNISGTMGVCYHKGTGKWEARLGRTYLGLYTNKIDAQEARALAQLDAGYHDNHGRVQC